MNEPVSSPSLLSITAPSAKPSRAVSDDFSKQLSSLAKTDDSRSSSSKKDVKSEEAPVVQPSDKEESLTETEQKATSTEEAVGTTTQEETAPSQNEKTDDLPVSNEAAEALAEELVVDVPIIVAPVSEKLAIPEELLPLEVSDEIVAVTDETPEESANQTTELLDLETDLESEENKSTGQLLEKPTAEGIALETDAPDAIVASAELPEKKPGEQELSTPITAEGNEEEEAIPVATGVTTNDQNSGEQKERKAPAEPSLLSDLNDAAIQGDGKEQNEAEPPVPKPAPAPAPLPAATVAAVEKTLPAEKNNLDNNDGAGRNASVGGIEERANQRAELAAAAKTRTNSAPSVDPSRFVSRVAKAFEAAQQQGGGPIRIRLSPPELGMLQIQIEVKEGVLTASLEAETHAARNLLLENLPALRDRLAEQQISIEKFDVDVRDEQSGPSYEQPNSQEFDGDTQDDRQNQRHSSTTDASNPRQANETSTTTPSTISFDNDRVDLVA